MSRRRSAAIAFAGLGLAFAAIVGGASAAFAHDSLVDAAPAQGETVSSVSELRLTFSGDLLGADTGADRVELVGPDGHHYETDCASVSEAVITAPVALGGSGTYQVLWRVVSSDGHPVSGDYTFEYTPAPDEPVATGSATSACASDTADTGTDRDATGAASAPASAGDGLVVGLVIGGIAIVAVGVVVTVILRTRRD